MVLPDPDVLSSYINFFFGIGTALAGAYCTLKAQGKIVYPVEKIEAGRAKIKALTESNQNVSKLVELIGNISPEEINAIFTEAATRYKDGSFSAADAQAIGSMAFEAIKEK
ncbi:MAG: hypothetical protein PHW84_02035 [Methanosarcina sp.]|nr:hypothetical protein [Methanosarcina sp.]